MKKNLKQISRRKKQYKIRKKISGNEIIPRLSVFKSNKSLYVQIIDDSNHKTIASSSTKELNLKGININNANLVGKDIAKKLKKLKIKQIVFDRSGYIYHGRVKAIADSIREEGIKI